MPQQDFDLILRVQADLQQAVKQLRDLNDNMRVTGATAVDASAGISRIGDSTKAAEAGIRNVNKGLGSLAASARDAQRIFTALRDVMVAGFAIHEVARFVGGLADANVEAQRIQFTLQQVFGEQGAKEQFAFIIDQAKRLGLNLQAAAQGYAQMAASAQGTGLQTRDLQKLFIGLSEAATVLHSSGEDVNAVMIQLAQGLSLGKLQMQDIRAIAQHLPGTMTSIGEAAQRMGLSMKDALTHGGLPAIQMIGSLGDVLHERFGVQAVAASGSLNAELQKLKSTFFEIETQSNGFADSLATAVHNLNIELNDPELKAGLQNLIAALGTIIEQSVAAAAKLGNFIHTGQELTEFALDRSVGGALSNQLALAQLKVDRDELAKREAAASSPDAGYLDSTANVMRVVRGVFAPDRGLGTTLKSAQQLRDEIDRLTASTTAYAKARDKVSTPKNPQEGDERGLFAGLPRPAAVSLPDASAAKQAAEIAKQAAKAQDDLTQSLISMQGQLDPTAAAWATYNAAVKKATDEAALAKKAKGADAAEIDAQRDAVIALAGTIRDAALDKIAEQDRQAWEALKRSFETPAQVRVDDALKQIAQLNKMLKNGVINAQQYHDALGEIGQKSVAGALPTYQGVDAAVAGPYGELQKNYQAQTALDTAYQAQKLALDQKFNDQDEAQHAAHVAALTALDEDRARKQKVIDDSRGQLQLSAASNLFGQLATLSSSHNKKMAAIGKAAAIAQAIITTYQSANEAFAAMASIPYIGPALGAAAAAVAIAAGLANVAQIRSQDVGGYKGGGAINGPGTGTSDSIPILASNGEFMHTAAAVRYYGVPFMDAVNNMRLPKFAGGGLIAPSPMANVPNPVFAAQPRLPTQQLAAQGRVGGGGEPVVKIYHVTAIGPDALAQAVLNCPTGEKLVVHHVAQHPTQIKGAWRS